MRTGNRRAWRGALLSLGFGVALLCGTLLSIHSGSTTVVISAVFYDTHLSGEPDEAFRLAKPSGSAVDLAGWTASDGEGTVGLTGTLGAGTSIWVAREASAFASQFGFSPADPAATGSPSQCLPRVVACAGLS